MSEDGALAATYTYNVNGGRASLTYANGNVTTYSYNLANWLTELVNKKGSTVVSSYSYGYYASGNQRTETDHEEVVTTYTYDGLGRLTQESSSEGKVYNYTYDANSNRASMVISNNGTTIESVVYTYDANNRLLREVNTLILSVETTEYAYDNNGNLLSNYVYSSSDTVISSLVYTYNGFNQQASVSANDGTITAHYTYNAQGIRDTKTLGITTTEFLLDGGAVVGEMRGLSTDTYLRGSNLISANGDTYYLFNGHGDVVNLTNTNGNSTKTYEYDAFGVEDDIDSNDLNPFRYCGEYFDNETGTYYLRARYYDPNTGRFTQEDPHWDSSNSIYGDTPAALDALGLTSSTNTPQILAIQQSGNLYVYCVGNPVCFTDPSGEISVKLAKVIIKGAYGGLTRAFNYAISESLAGNEVDAGSLLMQFLIGAGVGALTEALDIIADLVSLADLLITAFIEYTNGKSFSDIMLEVAFGLTTLLIGVGNDFDAPFGDMDDIANYVAHETFESISDTITESLIGVGNEVVGGISGAEDDAPEQEPQSEEVPDSAANPDTEVSNESPSTSGNYPSTSEEKSDNEDSPAHGGGGGICDARRIAMP